MLFFKNFLNLRSSVARCKDRSRALPIHLFHTSVWLKRQAPNNYDKGARSILYYLTAGGVFIGGLSYAAVPMYRIFCQVRFFF